MPHVRNRLSIRVTHADCLFVCTKGGAPGGQNVNKCSIKVRCTHRASGAVGVAADERSQDQNRKLAFMRMARTECFRRWAYLEAARLAGTLARIDEEVARQVRIGNLRFEVKDSDGRWVERLFNYELDEIPVNDRTVAVFLEGSDFPHTTARVIDKHRAQGERTRRG